MPRAPCKDCKKRAVGCHGTCEDYICFKKKAEEEQAAVRKENDPDYAAYVHLRRSKWAHKEGMQNNLHGTKVIKK